MKLTLNIDPDLAALWQPVIEHQCNLTLAPMVASVTNPKLSFSSIRVGGERLFQCRFSASLLNGTPLSLANEHADGRIAISGVFLRARRDVARHRRNMREPATLFSRRAVPEPPQ